MNWNITPAEAIALQKELREKVQIKKLAKKIKTIAGVDVSSNMFSTTLYAGIIILSFPDMQEIDYSVVQIEATMPYIPGLLSFREIPALMKAWENVKVKADLLMVDGQGICHPRRLGIATHLGLLLDMPTIGAAKSLLTGIYDDLETEAGSISYIRDKYIMDREEIIGAAVRTKTRSNPMIISPGHKITLKESIEIVQKSLKGYRLPEPTRKAHELVNKFRRGEIK